MLPKTFGHFIEKLPKQEEYLTIGFSPSFLPLKKRWQNNGLSADFIADYFKTFFVSKQEEDGVAQDELFSDNLRDAVKYIANELLENAMKFQDETVPYTARIGFSLYNDKLIFCVTNGINETQIEPFQTFVKELLTAEPQELYLNKMRANAMDTTNSNAGGLGLLSMICDYSAKLGWKFDTLPVSPPMFIVSTMVCLDLQ